jgi:cyclopropane-fatty-acyl-phospholipid synthase
MPLTRYLEKKVINQMRRIQVGAITWESNGVSQVLGNPNDPLKATITIDNPAFYKQLAFRGSLGAGESYVKGDWRCDDLTQLMQIIIKNESILNTLDKRWAALGTLLRSLKNRLSHNHVKRNKKNILAHYDLSNALFERFLDPSMLYSSAIFANEEQSLEAAQHNKLRLICERLALKPTDHLLEIGTGWGALALYAAQEYGCQVTTTTISEAQYTHTEDLIKQRGLQDRITLCRQDYRHLTGSYDKIVSIEMIESIGHHYFTRYFKTCDHLLKKGGTLLLQAITMNDQEYPRYKQELDFIKAYIFPGGCLPCIAQMARDMQKHTQLQIREIHDIGLHYARTLALWNKNFQDNAEAIQALGFDERFLRLFQFYFTYCEAGFLSRYISNVHMIIEKN